MILIGLTLVCFAGCSGVDKNSDARGVKKAGKGRLNGEGTPPQAAVPVAVEKVKIGEISSYYTATATLSAEKEAQILARVSGVVDEIHCEEGNRVKSGQVLMTIDNEEYRYRLSQAEANRMDLRSRFERVQELQKKKLVSQEEYEGLENSLKAAIAEEEMTRLTLSYTQVAAPFGGVIVSRTVDVGQTISVGTPLFVLSDFDPLLARVHVPAKEFGTLKSSQPVELILESSKQKLQGRITLISPIIDPSSGTIKVTIEIPDYPPGVRPGDFAEVRIVTEHRMDRMLIPRIAVVTSQGESIVYIAADGKALSRPVKIGFENDDVSEIVSGLELGDLVIVKGQRIMKPDSPIKIMDEEPAVEEAAAKPDSTIES